jgi:hypothetical protein
MGILRLTRPTRLLPDRWNPYTVVIDGETVGEIADGETVEIQVGAGTHTAKVENLISFASFGCGETDFTLGARETVEFVVRARVPGLDPIRWFQPHRWLELRRASIRKLRAPGDV